MKTISVIRLFRGEKEYRATLPQKVEYLGVAAGRLNILFDSNSPKETDRLYRLYGVGEQIDDSMNPHVFLGSWEENTGSDPRYWRTYFVFEVKSL